MLFGKATACDMFKVSRSLLLVLIVLLFSAYLYQLESQVAGWAWVWFVWQILALRALEWNAFPTVSYVTLQKYRQG